MRDVDRTSRIKQNQAFQDSDLRGDGGGSGEGG